MKSTFFISLWTKKECTRQIKLRHEQISLCVGQLYPSTLYSEIDLITEYSLLTQNQLNALGQRIITDRETFYSEANSVVVFKPCVITGVSLVERIKKHLLQMGLDVLVMPPLAHSFRQVAYTKAYLLKVEPSMMIDGDSPLAFAADARTAVYERTSIGLSEVID